MAKLASLFRVDVKSNVGIKKFKIHIRNRSYSTETHLKPLCIHNSHAVHDLVTTWPNAYLSRREYSMQRMYIIFKVIVCQSIQRQPHVMLPYKVLYF